MTSRASAARARATARVLRAHGIAPPDPRAAELSAAASWPPLADAVARETRAVVAAMLRWCPRVVLTLPGPPKPKGRPRFYRDGATGAVHTKTPKETRAHEAHVREVASWQAVGAEWPRGGYEGARYYVDATFVLAADAGDYDNLTKTIDALNGLIWPDDRHVSIGHTTKRVARPGEKPGSTLFIWAIRPGDKYTP